MTQIISHENMMLHFREARWFVAGENIPFRMDKATFWRLLRQHRAYLIRNNIPFKIRQEAIDADTRDSLIRTHFQLAESAIERGDRVSGSIEDLDLELGFDDSPNSS
tara:strand:- start:839 stop:1159 length:321 start_codon:yes stop_codon:yes gene_type:complete